MTVSTSTAEKKATLVGRLDMPSLEQNMDLTRRLEMWRARAARWRSERRTTYRTSSWIEITNRPSIPYLQRLHSEPHR